MLNDVILYDPEIAEKCVYGPDFVKDILCIDGHDSLYISKNYYTISSKKLEGLIKLCKYRNYYQQNPVRFIHDFFNIQLLDSQAYLITEAWNKGQVMWLCSRAYGKSFLVVLFCMAKQMLSVYPWNCYIASGSAEQSATTFKKLEDIANDRISSLVNSSGSIFKAEVEISAANGDGFSHNPAGFEYHLYNGSTTKSLNSNVDRNRGKRAQCVIFDETSFLDSDLLEVYKAFCAMDTDFKTGISENGETLDNVRLHIYPKGIQNQLIYVSSASSTDTDFYRMYREFSKKMLLGNPNYFVADIDCELTMRPTIGGNRVKAALTRELIESAMSVNPTKGRREYFNEFSEDAGADAILKRGTITRNEKTYKPSLENETGDKKYIICYDPARQRDNSFILVIEMYEVILPDGTIDLHGRLANGINLLDAGKKLKSPMQTPDQVKYLKKIICDYNGGADAYGNIVGVYIDAGSGGGGVGIADYLMQDWTDEAGTHHRGLIDKEYSKEYVSKFPNAVDKVHLISPMGFKSIMYESLIEMVNQDKIDFPASYDNKGYLTIFDVDDELIEKEKQKIISKLKKQKVPDSEFDAKVQEELAKVQSVKTKVIKLDFWEESALAQIDSLKEEVLSMVRKKRESGKDSFELVADKANKMHDDRSYTLALGCYALAEERRKLILKKPKTNNNDLLDKLRKTMKKGGAR